MKKTSFIRLFVTLFLLTSSLVQTTNIGIAGPSGTRSGTNAAPIAVDDSGPGFSTDENTAIHTPNVLSNDSDPDHDNLYVKSIDTSLTLGTLSIPLIEGSLDSSFSGDGIVTENFGGSGAVGNAFATQNDSKILIAGGSGGDFAIARYNPDGNLDLSFDNDGLVTTNVYGDLDSADTMALQADGKIILGGQTGIGYTLVRYNPDGSLDESFGNEGKLVTVITNFNGKVNWIAVQTDGKIILAGKWGSDFVLLRYNQDGTLDTSFNGNGQVDTDFGGGDEAKGIAIQSNGKIILVGRTWVNYAEDFAIARYNLNGQLDTSFNGNGKVTTDFGEGEKANAVAIQPDGRIVVAGSGGYGKFALARYNPNGSLDTSFSGDGKVITDFGGQFVSCSANAVALQPDGKIIAAGEYGGYFAVVRYNQDGTEDATFDGDGRVITNILGLTPANIRGVAVQPDGKIVAGGYAGSSMALACYLGGGTLIYDPNHQFDWLRAGHQVTDTFTYVVSDGVLTDTATVSVTINGRDGIYLPVVIKKSAE